ncbi:MAG TPA: GNAT family N-acetyltransferase [Solirubrobacteraceae bacterium]|jgi:GNAT superfamily N-acetyltransferase
MQPSIRPAVISDYGRVTELLELLGRPRVRNEDYAACRDVFAAQLEDPETLHLVAVDSHDDAVGFCSLHFRSRLNRPDLQAWVPDLIVQDAARGRGTARALLQEAERIARERGCGTITLESGYERSAAHLLYRAAGMEDGGKFFRKSLAV